MLFTDLYELSMASVYDAEDMNREVVFELFFRQLPADRDYVLACGQTACAQALSDFHFSRDDIEWLAGSGRFSEAFLQRLGELRFSGEVSAVAEGSAVFPFEPVLQVRAPLIEAQLIETLLLNTVHSHSVLASKAARIIQAAQWRPVMDFGARKAQGREGAMNLARAAWIAGAAGTSNVEAARALDIPMLGTMAHSFVQAYDDEYRAFSDFSRHWPETTLLIDTWDTVRGVDRVIELLREGREPPAASSVRLDSGDLLTLSGQVREKLDQAGFPQVKILVSSGLDEYAIRDLLAAGAPIDGFGVGTEWAAIGDAPSIDFAYKLAEYDGEPRMKASRNKATWPGAKQVWRQWRDGTMMGDWVMSVDEPGPSGAEPLLRPLLEGGELNADACPELGRVREYAAGQLAGLPAPIRGLDPARTPYPVTISERLQSAQQTLMNRYR